MIQTIVLFETFRRPRGSPSRLTWKTAARPSGRSGTLNFPSCLAMKRLPFLAKTFRYQSTRRTCPPTVVVGFSSGRLAGFDHFLPIRDAEFPREEFGEKGVAEGGEG